MDGRLLIVNLLVMMHYFSINNASKPCFFLFHHSKPLMRKREQFKKLLADKTTI